MSIAARKGGTRPHKEDRYQALDNLEQFLHHHGDALVAEQTADGLEVRRAHKVPVGAVYVGVGDVEGLEGERDRQRSFYLFLAIEVAIFQKEQFVTLDP